MHQSPVEERGELERVVFMQHHDVWIVSRVEPQEMRNFMARKCLPTANCQLPTQSSAREPSPHIITIFGWNAPTVSTRSD